MKNTKCAWEQSVWMFIFGLVVGVLLVSGIMFLKTANVDSNSGANLFRWNKPPYFSTEVYKDLGAQPQVRSNLNSLVKNLDSSAPISGISPSL